MSAKRTKELAEIKSGLNSSEEVLIMDALKKTSSKGDVSLLSDLVNLHVVNEDSKIQKEIENILFGLKASAALDELITISKNAKNTQVIALALSAIWQSGFSAANHLTALVILAIQNNFDVAMEVMTIIENSEFDENQEEDIDHNLLVLKQEIQTKKNANQTLLETISSILIDKKISGE